MRLTRAGAALAAMSIVGALGGGARAQNGEDCARIEEPLAYNACLAERGPKARLVEADKAKAAHGAAFAMHERHPRSGRAHLEIPVGPSRR